MSIIVEPAASSRTRSSSGYQLPAWWPTAAFALAALAAAVVLMYEGRGLTFWFDEWLFIIERRDPSLEALLDPHGGHLSVLPVAIYELFLQIFGLTHYAAFRALVLVTHFGCAALIFTYLRRRLDPLLALVPTVVILFYGAAWQDLLWPFQIGFVISVAAGVGAFLLLESPTLRARIGVMACICVALASSSPSLPICVAVALELVLSRRWRQLWIVVLPLIGWAVWYVTYSEPLSTVKGVVEFGRFWVEAAGAVIGSLVGVGSDAGQVLLIVVIPVIVWRIVRAEPERRPRMLALAAIPTVYWGLLAISRAGFQPAGASRYLYPAASFIVLLAAELMRGVRIRKVVAAGLVVVAAWSVVWNVAQLQDGRTEVLFPFTRRAQVQYGAIDIGVRGVEPAWRAIRPEPKESVSGYVDAFRDLGSPGLGPAAIRRKPEDLRRMADAFLLSAAGIVLRPTTAPSGDAPDVVRGDAGAADGGSCVLFRVGTRTLDVELAPHTNALHIEALGATSADVRIRNFGDEYSTFDQPFAIVPPGDARDLPLPRVTAGPWLVGLRSSTDVRVCGAELPSN